MVLFTLPDVGLYTHSKFCDAQSVGWIVGMVVVVVGVSGNQVLASQLDGSLEVGDRLDGTVSDRHH